MTPGISTLTHSVASLGHVVRLSSEGLMHAAALMQGSMLTRDSTLIPGSALRQGLMPSPGSSSMYHSSHSMSPTANMAL